MPDNAPSLSIGQVADRTGLSVHTLRFYEREGVMVNPVRRDAGGRRVYSEDDVGWLTLCTILRASDMPLPVLREYMELIRQGEGNEEERLALLHRHRRDVVARIRRLTECLDLVDHKVGVYEDIIDRSAPGHGCGPRPAGARDARQESV
ncbi:MerR family transcriptional regulator [Actinocorallia libanotica]|uniref:MerR family transcriptional regulator n=1 Tax=Actinocorallia libanotica TaxID=46162 RepID=A0ABP4C9Z7_9ACTN